MVENNKGVHTDFLGADYYQYGYKPDKKTCLCICFKWCKNWTYNKKGSRI
jgi:hypothetical protein